MASEWARKKAEELLASSFVEHIEECQHGMWDEPGCTCGHEDLRDAIAAALDEAQERGGKEALVKAVPLKELPLKLGHEFVPYRGYFVESKVCIFLGCGQPREAH